MTLSRTHRFDLFLQRVAVAWATWRKARENRGQAAKPPVIRGVRYGDDPPVLVMCDYVFEFALRERPDFWAQWAGRPALIILLRSWEITNATHVRPMKALAARHRQTYPGHRVVYAANTPGEMDVLAANDFEAVFCNHNALVDENVFCPSPEAKAGDAREFDAIYDARICRFKRHHLAARVPRLALVHYAVVELCEPLWWLAMRFRLRRAKVLNRKERGFWRWPFFLTPSEVAVANRRARTGLCLSEVEGAMVASIQYLLCGLPVVTTASRGGRDQFFDAYNSLEVASDARAVADGVRTMIARNPDPWKIRAATIARMQEHRVRLVAFVDAFQAEHGVPPGERLSARWPGCLGNAFKNVLG